MKSSIFFITVFVVWSVGVCLAGYFIGDRHGKRFGDGYKKLKDTINSL